MLLYEKNSPIRGHVRFVLLESTLRFVCPAPGLASSLSTLEVPAMTRHGIASSQRLRHWAAALLFVSASFAVTANVRPAHAQDLRYRPPAGSTISPAFDFFRGDVQMLDFYSGTVRPNRALRSAVARQGMLLNQRKHSPKTWDCSASQATSPGKYSDSVAHLHWFGEGLQTNSAIRSGA